MAFVLLLLEKVIIRVLDQGLRIRGERRVDL